jgi:hypothetical protein
LTPVGSATDDECNRRIATVIQSAKNYRHLRFSMGNACVLVHTTEGVEQN